MSLRRRLPFAEWPSADRAMWESLFRAGDVLDPSGPLAHLRPASRDIHQTAYAFWLGFLSDRGESLDDTAPQERMNEESLRAYLDSLGGLSLGSKAQRVHRLYLTFKAAFPDEEFLRLRTVSMRLQRMQSRAATTRRPAAEVSAAVLVRLGEDLPKEAETLPDLSEKDRSCRARDGAAILCLACVPLRIGAFARLEIGRSLLRTEEGFSLMIEPAAMKSGRPLTLRMPARAAAALGRWLEGHRQVFARPGVSGAFVWLSATVRPIPPYKLSERIAAVTRERLGVALSAHRFRVVAATTIAETAPDHARLIPALLGHSSAKMADLVYNQAAMRRAAARFHEVLAEAGRLKGR